MTGGSGAGAESRRLALRVLVAVEAGARSDRALDRQLARTRLSELDRRLVTEIVYGSLRVQDVLDRTLQRFCRHRLQQLSPAVRVAMRIGLYQAAYLRSVPDRAAVHTAVESLSGPSRRARGLVNAVLRNWLRSGGRLLLEDTSIAGRCSVPHWLAERWQQRYGSDVTERWFTAARTQPPVAVRVHPRRICVRDALRLLRQHGLQAQPSAWHALALRVGGAHPATTCLREHPGLSLRGEAGQLVCDLLAVGGEAVLDACAGRGGKAIQLAETGAPRVVAIDRRPDALRQARAAADRAGTGDELLVVVADMTSPPLQGCYRRILVDAPCSGLGTLRRHPEIRWRVQQTDLLAYARVQRRILLQAARCLAPGGRLLYVTCSTEPEENEQVVESVLAVDAGLRHVPLEAESPVAGLIGADGSLRTYPSQPDLDGFFAAALTRDGTQQTDR